MTEQKLEENPSPILYMLISHSPPSPEEQSFSEVVPKNNHLARSYMTQHYLSDEKLWIILFEVLVIYSQPDQLRQE